MKKGLLVIGFMMVTWTVCGQTVTNADCHEDGQKAVVTYSLDQEANIDLQMSLNGAEFRTLDRTSLSGDVGTNVRKGKNKKIVWDVLQDCNSLVGNVQFRVVPSESLNAYNKRIKRENYYRNGYPATCNQFYNNVGTWSVSFADVGIGGGFREHKGQVPLYFGIGTFRYKFIEVSIVAFSVELTTAPRFDNESYSYGDETQIFWEPQVRFLVPMTDHWALVFAGGPSLDIMADYDRWWFAATARVRYAMSLAQTEVFVGYEHHAIVAGVALSLRWSKK